MQLGANAISFGSRQCEVGTKNNQTRVSWVSNRLKAIAPGKRILDAGAGEMQFKSMCSHLRYVSQDFAQYQGSGDGRGLQMGSWVASHVDIVSDITSIPEQDGSFDAILCTEVFEHLPDPIAAITEFKRLLKPEGEIIITAPFCSLTHFSPYHYYTGFNRYFYEHHLCAAGFRVLEITENGNFFEFVAQELRRIDDVCGRYCGEKATYYERWAIKLILMMLDRLSKSDRGSKELLNFDLQVYAVKVV